MSAIDKYRNKREYMRRRVLTIAAHPDDEVLGSGAAMAKHVHNGDEVHVLIMAEGITSRQRDRDRKDNKEELSELALAAHQAKAILGVSSLVLKNFPDNRMDGIDFLDVVKCIEDHLCILKPDIVYTHHAGDLNLDHRIVHRAVITACRPQPDQTVRQLLFFEVPSSTEWQTPGSGPAFNPNWFVDIADRAGNNESFISIKIKALHIYNNEMRAWPHSRSTEAIEHLARWRGSSVGFAAAEAFVLGRQLA